MSKRLSIIGTTALIVVALLGSAVLVPALQKPAPAQSMETAAPTMQLAAMQSASDMTVSGTEGEILDYTFVFAGAEDDGTDGWGSPKVQAAAPHAWGTTDDLVFD